VWWAIPPLVIVLVVAVYPLLRVCLESFKGKPGESGWSTWTSVLLALVGLGRIRGRAAVR
jgi:2-aminoethylphosphonate transport system permease protein